jgi:hypothetical protein
MPSAPELDAEVRRLRRTMRRLIGVMTLALVVGVAVVVAVLAASLSTADKQALQAFSDGARAPDGTAAAAKQAHRAPAPAARETVGQAAVTQPPAAVTPAPDPRRTAERPPAKMPPQRPTVRAPAVQSATGDSDANGADRPREESRAVPRGPAPHRRPARARPTDQAARPAGEPADRVTLSAPRRPVYALAPEEAAPDQPAREARRDGESSDGPFGLFGALFGPHPDRNGD